MNTALNIIGAAILALALSAVLILGPAALEATLWALDGMPGLIEHAEAQR